MQKHFYPQSLSGRILRSVLIITLLCLLSNQTASGQASASIEQTNREVVRQAFDEWAKGGSNFFDILASDAQWTIKGTGVSAGTYRSREEFLNKAVKPFAARLSKPIVPTVRAIFADGDQIIVLWDGEATTKDNKIYRNSYAWFFKMKNGKVIEAIAFLDLPAYQEVLERVKNSSPAN